MKPVRVAIIGTVGIPAKYGGFETLAEQLVHHMADKFQTTVYCTGKKYPRHERRKDYKGARLIYLPFDANGISSIIYDCLSILHALLFADVLLVLGVSGGIMLPLVRLFPNRRLIVSIDGIEWKREKWIKPAKWYLWWAEKIAVKYSHADISDNESIQDYTAYRYKTLSNIIEYGADHTMKVEPSADDIARYTFLTKPYACKVCRIEPENNVHTILEAFATMQSLPFVMIGNWEKSTYGKELKQQYGKYGNIILLDAIYEQRVLDLIRGNASLYVHGHSAGGTNPSLVEAMYLRLPVVAFNVSYNKTTTENKAWYFSGSQDLIRVVSARTPESLLANARAMKAIADRRYTWKAVADKYIHLINKVLLSRDKVTVAAAAKDVQIKELLDLEVGHLAYPSLFYEKR